MKCQQLLSIRVAVCTLLAIGHLSVRSEQPTPTQWKTECVGRMQLGVPGDAEVAAHTVASWHAQRKSGNNAPMRFIDETTAGWSRQTDFIATHALPPKELDALYRSEIWTKESFLQRAIDSPRFPYVKNSFRAHSIQPLDGAGWSFGIKNISDRQVLVARLGDHLVRWDGWAQGVHEHERMQKEFAHITNNLQLRTLFSLPGSSGICYPYLFLKDDDDRPWSRGVAATYRLKDHPDITVWLSDANAAGRMEGETSRHQGARYNAEFFWRQRYQKRREVSSLFSVPTRFPATRMAGYPGVESYVKLTREDGTLDFGYLVSVRGDPDARQDEPDLMLYVIRDAAEARVRGLEPYGDEESFLALARSIAATVKRRPVAARASR